MATALTSVTSQSGAYERSGGDRTGYSVAGVLLVILAGFVLLGCLLPLRTAVQIGSDEGFELAKATLYSKGHRLYSEIWNDQPPLHTFLVAKALTHLSSSILIPRLLTVGFACLLICSVFLMGVRVGGLFMGAVSTALLVASPEFLVLSASCMLEIPALAAAVAGLCVLLLLGNARWHVAEVVAGILFGVATLLKLVPVILLAVAALILWLRYRESPHTIKRTFLSLAILGASLAVTFLVLDLVIDGGAYLANFQQSWVSHFGAAKTSEYGSAKDYPFAWSVLLNNWDTSIPAAVGIAVAIRQARQLPLALVPVGWLALSFLVFGIHRPWWPYYYIHTAVPLCLCAALGIRAVSRDVLRRVPFSGKAFIDGVQRLRTEKGTPLPRILRFLAAAGLAVCGLCAAAWMGGRVYLQIESVRHAPQTYSTLVLSEIERFKPSVDWIYADKLVYSFHSGIPVPPQLAVVPLKRLWSGEMTSARLADEVNKYQPGLIVLNNDGREMPFQELLDRDYRLVYEDTEDRLYAHRGLKAKP